MRWKHIDKFEKYNKLEQWHKWFAWFPVRIGVRKKDDKNIVWFEYVERRGELIIHSVMTDRWEWSYREIQIDIL